jgi:hypothetical protein
MESHDEERLMFKTLNYGSSSGTYNTRNFTTAINRMKLDALFFLSLPGPKMIWQFGELGYDISIEQGGRVSEKPILWNYYSNSDRFSLFQFYKLMNNLRKNHPVFTTDNFSWSLASAGKRISLCGPDMCVNILGNFGLTEAVIDPEFVQTGKWYEYFSGDSITVTNLNMPINLGAGEYKLYSTARLTPANIILDVNDNILSHERHFITAYPNPSGGPFRFTMNDQEPSPVYLTVFDISGNQVRQIVTNVTNENDPVIWDGRTASGTEVPAGLYIVQIKTGKRTGNIKIVKN